MMAKRTRTYLPATNAAASLLGAQIAQARKERSWTAVDLAERVGVSRPTIAGVEKGSTSVAIGVYLEAAVLLGIPLFSADSSELSALAAAAHQRLALLPARVNAGSDQLNNDF